MRRDKLTAAELDRVVAAETAYRKVLADGASEEQAKRAAEDAVKAKADEQFRRKFLGGEQG